MDDAGPALEHLLRTESGRVLGGLVRRFGDLDLAEDVFQEACLEALQRWPLDGVPGNPAAWLTTVARNRALDRVRRERLRPGKEADSLGLREGDADGQTTWSASTPDDEGPLADDELRLILLCCHPALAQDAQVALTLRAVCGLTTSEVAAAFLVPEPTMAQRVVRAKRKIALAGIPFRLPEGAELAERLAPALNVVYLVFNEGYAATSSDLPVRRELCAEAVRLARLLVDLAPGDPEALGLLALLLLQDSRRAARVDAAGRLVPLAEQDRALWDGSKIDEGSALVEQALASGRLGPYQLQAAVAALHARATDAEPVDWSEIHALYRIHEVVAPSPMVTLNRAVALARLEGPEAGLTLVEDLRASGALAGHHRLESVRAHLLEESGRVREAQVAFGTAADLATSPAERDYLRARATGP